MLSAFRAYRNDPRYYRSVQRFSIVLLFLLNLGVLGTVHENYSSVFCCLCGLLLVRVGSVRPSRAVLAAGLVLQAAGAFVFLDGAFYPFKATYFVNIYFYGCLLIGLASLFSGYLVDRAEGYGVRLRNSLSVVLIFWSVCWLYYAGVREVVTHTVGVGSYNILLLYFCAISIVLTIMAEKLEWQKLALAQIMLLPAAAACYFWGMAETLGYYHLFGSKGWLAWLVAVFSLYRLLHHYDGAWPRTLAGVGHIGTLWLVVLVCCSELIWFFSGWLNLSLLAAALIRFGLPIVIALLLIGLRNLRLWPLSGYRYYYLWGAILLPAVAIGAHELVIVLG